MAPGPRRPAARRWHPFWPKATWTGAAAGRSLGGCPGPRAPAAARAAARGASYSFLSPVASMSSSDDGPPGLTEIPVSGSRSGPPPLGAPLPLGGYAAQTRAVEEDSDSDDDGPPGLREIPMGGGAPQPRRPANDADDSDSDSDDDVPPELQDAQGAVDEKSACPPIRRLLARRLFSCPRNTTLRPHLRQARAPRRRRARRCPRSGWWTRARRVPAPPPLSPVALIAPLPRRASRSSSATLCT